VLRAVAVTDPAWFFSTMSQAAAAIIGLLGALLLSRFLQELADVRSSRLQLVQDFAGIRGTARSHRDFVREYGAFLDRQIPLEERALGEGAKTRLSGEWHTFRSSGVQASELRRAAAYRLLPYLRTGIAPSCCARLSRPATVPVESGTYNLLP